MMIAPGVQVGFVPRTYDPTKAAETDRFGKT
jgi:hypothetical protein